MTADDFWPLLALGGAIFLGTSTQRISGVGFALVASPFLVAILGPFNGVLVVNVFGALTALLVLSQVFRLVEYRRAILLLVPAILAIVPGSLVALYLRSDVLSMLIGTMIIVALVASLVLKEGVLFRGRSGVVLAGAVSGFMSVTAGVGGPALTAYAVATRWPHAAFAATAQLYFFGTGVASLSAKHTLPQLDGYQWATCAVALGLGVLVGNTIAPRVPAKAARFAVIVLAFAGAVLILTKGAASLAGTG